MLKEFEKVKRAAEQTNLGQAFEKAISQGNKGAAEEIKKQLESINRVNFTEANQKFEALVRAGKISSADLANVIKTQTGQAMRSFGDEATKAGDVGKRSLDGVRGSALELYAKIGLLKEAFGAVNTALHAFGSLIDRGQGVHELTTSFEALQEASGGVVNSIDVLRDATEGLVADQDLMRASNEAVISGLKPEQFLEVAKAADTLGDAFGRSTKDALNDLTTALATGQERLLKRYSITIDNAKAERDFAATVHTTAEALNEAGKREANRLAILEAVKGKTDILRGATETRNAALQNLSDSLTAAGVSEAERAEILEKAKADSDALAESTEGLSQSNKTAGDSLQSYKTAVQNIKDEFARAFVTNENLNSSMSKLAARVSEVDVQSLAHNFAAVANAAAVAVDAIDKFAAVIRYAFSSDSEAQLARLYAQLDDIRELQAQLREETPLLAPDSLSSLGGSSSFDSVFEPLKASAQAFWQDWRDSRAEALEGDAAALEQQAASMVAQIKNLEAAAAASKLTWKDLAVQFDQAKHEIDLTGVSVIDLGTGAIQSAASAAVLSGNWKEFGEVIAAVQGKANGLYVDLPKLTKEFEKLEQSANLEKLGADLEKATKAGDKSQIKEITNELLTLKEVDVKKSLEPFGALVDAGVISAERLEEVLRTKLTGAATEFGNKTADAGKQASTAIDGVRDRIKDLEIDSQKLDLSSKLEAALKAGDFKAADEIGAKLRDVTAKELVAGFTKGGKEGGPALQKAAEEGAALAGSNIAKKALLDIEGSIKDILDSRAQDQLSESFEKALTEGNFAAAASLKEQIYQNTVDATRAANAEAYSTGDPKVRAGIEQLANLRASIEAEKAGKAIEEAQKAAFQRSVDFFGEFLTTTITGTAQDLEQILEDALKRVAIGFGAQILASLAQGIPGIGGLLNGVTSAQGFGQSLAGALGFGGPGSPTLGNLFGGGSAPGGSFGNLGGDLTGIVSNFFGGGGAAGAGDALTAESLNAAFSNAGIGTVGGLGVAEGATASISQGLLAAAPMIGAAIAGGFVAQQSVSGIQSVAGGGKLSFGEQAALALPTFGASFLYNPVSDFFGGDSKLAQEREARAELLEGFRFTDLGQDLKFPGVNGPISLDENAFNVDHSRSFGRPSDNKTFGDLVGLVNPFAMTNTGGDDKLGGDLAGIFTNAISDADNFNEAIINAISLMEKIGPTAEEQKGVLTNLFLDGKISLEEFTTGVANLNMLAQENLVGPNSVSDAIAVMTKNIEENPRTALKGLELAFKEMAELGIDTTSEVHAFVVDKFGPEIAEAFDRLGAAGIDSFEDVKDAGPDAIAAIFNAIRPLVPAFEETFGVAAEGSQELSSNTEDAASSARGLEDRWRSVGRGIADATDELRSFLTLQERAAGAAGGGSGAGSGTEPAEEDDGGGETDRRFRTRNAARTDSNPANWTRP